MADIDARLQANNVPITARELRAIGVAAQMLDTELWWPRPGTQPKPESYSAADLPAHISAWMRRRYGDRLKVDFSLGSALLTIRGDPWLIRFALIYGRVQLTCDPDLSHEYKNLAVYRPGVPTEPAKLNILRCVQDLPQALASQLSHEELVGIMKFYLDGHEFLGLLDSFCRAEPLPAAAKIDLSDAAEQGVAGEASYGHSKWASLQAAEKLLKFYLARRGLAFPKIHDLTELANAATDAGLSPIDPAIISAAQCDASVRYDPKGITTESIVRANQAAVQIGRVTMKALFGP